MKKTTKNKRTKIVYIVCVFGQLHIQSLDNIPMKYQNKWTENKPIIYSPYKLTTI